MNLITASLISLPGMLTLTALPVQAADKPQAVTVDITGLENQALRQDMRALSALAGKDQKFSAMALLTRKAKSDAKRMEEALVSLGYYAARITPEVEGGPASARVIFKVERGPLFRITAYEITFTDDPALNGKTRPMSLAEAGIKTKGSADGKDLKALQDKYRNWLYEHGFPVARAVSRRVDADFNTATGTALFGFESGPGSVFGEIEVSTSGLHTDADFIRRMKTWKTGQTWDRRKVAAYQEALSKTGLFNDLEAVAGTPDENGVTPVLVRASERKRRTVGTGLSFASDVGPGGRVYWENRNLWGGAERVTVQLAASGPEQKLNAGFSQPFPRWRGDINASAALANETTDAYESQSLSLSGGFSKNWPAQNLEASAGVKFTSAQITESDGAEESSAYLSFPVTAAWDTQNSLLNPTSGSRLSAGVTPYAGDGGFAIAKLSGATHYGFGEKNKTVIAARAALGATLGAERATIPATERFYAGGGSSVRGYAWQSVGPLDTKNDPLGGASKLEASLELRQMVGSKWQAALFTDTGLVSDAGFPDFSEGFYTGAGLGVRYITPVGPFRIDVATPLDKRPGDDPVQVYISLGQPF